MNSALLLKIAFWMVLVGTAALLAPNPAWPEWVARMVISAGVGLAVAGLAAPAVKRWKQSRRERD